MSKLIVENIIFFHCNNINYLFVKKSKCVNYTTFSCNCIIISKANRSTFTSIIFNYKKIEIIYQVHG